MLRRTIYSDVQAIAVGKMKQVAPDVQLKMFHPTLGTEVGTDELEGLMIQSDGEVCIFVMTAEIKEQLLAGLTGGVKIATADEMPGGAKLHSIGGGKPEGE